MIRKLVRNLVIGQVASECLTVGEIDAITDRVVDRLYGDVEFEVKKYLIVKELTE